MASIVLASVGASVGNTILPGIGGRVLGSLGKQAGQDLEEAWGWRSQTGGKRLSNFKIQDSSYGAPLPILFGTSRVAGNVIWASDLIETAHQASVFGGKGGSYSSSSTTYTYALHCAVALAAGEIGEIQTIWADSKIIYQNGVWISGIVGSATFHNGAMDQETDPLLESWIGAGLTPAYRGTAYVVLESLQLSNFGNRMPNLTFEILPKDPTGQPEWLGTADPNFYHAIVANRNQAMPPLVIEGGSARARKIIIGGYKMVGATSRFVVAEYDVTGDAPLEIARTESAAFAGEDCGGHSWDMAADGRFVAIGFQDAGTGKYYSLAIYDAQTRSFGSPVSVSMAISETRRVAWIDEQRFVICGSEGGKRGVYVFMRSGLEIVSLGFFNVWGAGTQSSLFPEMFAQFIPCEGGLLHFMVDETPDFNVLAARHLAWKNNTLSLGAAFNVISGADMGTGTTAQAYLFRTGEDEWTFFYGTTIDIRLFSFTATSKSASLTRPLQIIKNASFSTARCHAPVLIGNKIVVMQRSTLENAYRLSEISLLPAAFSLDADGKLLENFEAVGLHFSVMALSATRLLAAVNWGTLGDLGRLDIIKRRNTGDTLDQIVAKILLRSGYESGDFDVSALAGIEVDGYVLDEQENAASALEPLRLFEPFDLVESEGQLRAVLRGRGDVWEIDASETEAGGSASMKTRAREGDLPAEVCVAYEDATRDYETGAQKARRAVTKGAENVLKLALPIVVAPFKAKQIAQERLYGAWFERSSCRLFLSRACLGIEAGDVVVLGGERWRVTETRLEKGVLRVDGVASPEVLLSGNAQADGGAQGGGFKNPVASTLCLMDLPLLRNEDDAPGLYAAVSGLEGWNGAGLFRAADGVNFSQIASFAKAATIGWAASVLADGPVHYTDGASVLRVQLLRGELAGCSRAELLTGANAALVGGEIIQFESASLIGPGLYELRNLLRGRRGTEDKTAEHVAGEIFVLLSQDSIQFLPAQLSDRDAAYHFRAVSNNAYLDYAADHTATYEFKTLRPFAPVHLRSARREDGGLLLSWVRRARKNAAWVDYIDVPLDEEAELYDVEIVNETSGAIIRAYENVAQNVVTYSAAEQAADWGGAASAFVLRVYQKSARYGRGQKAEARFY